LSTRRKSIGTRNESSLHRALKHKYAGPGGRTEIKVGDFIADGVRKNGEYIEVQTGSFAPLKKKAAEFALRGRVRIIHPIAVTKTIEVYDAGKTFLYRRKSPVRGSPWSLFDALLHAPELPLNPAVAIEIVLADITEKRVRDGKGSWRRKGVSIKDRELSVLRESLLYKGPSDYLRFVPFKRNEEFTASMLAKRAEVSQWTAQKALYVLTKLKVVKRIGRKARELLYKRSR